MVDFRKVVVNPQAVFPHLRKERVGKSEPAWCFRVADSQQDLSRNISAFESCIKGAIKPYGDEVLAFYVLDSKYFLDLDDATLLSAAIRRMCEHIPVKLAMLTAAIREKLLLDTIIRTIQRAAFIQLPAIPLMTNKKTADVFIQVSVPVIVTEKADYGFTATNKKDDRTLFNIRIMPDTILMDGDLTIPEPNKIFRFSVSHEFDKWQPSNDPKVRQPTKAQMTKAVVSFMFAVIFHTGNQL